MLTLILYQKDHKRQPVRFGYSPLFRDLQASLPVGWCSKCGSEVFEDGMAQCPRCRTTKGEKLP